MAHLTIDDLRTVLKEFSERYRQLRPDDIFVLWFLRAYVTSNESTAVTAVVGGGGDKSNDAILVDDAARTVFVVQSKNRKKLNGKSEIRNDLVGFADVSHQLSNPSDRIFKTYLEKMDELTAIRAKEARRRIIKDGYRLHLFFVTLGKVSRAHRNDAEEVVRRARCEAAIEIIDGRRVMVIFRDYLGGFFPGGSRHGRSPGDKCI